MGIIKQCDIRGRYPSELDERTSRSLGRAVGARIAGQSIVVGGDVRLSTISLKAQLIDGLVESGVNVIDIGTVPTPAFYYSRRVMNIHNGIMVTASHNPAVYNGFKITLGEQPIEAEQLKSIAADMDAGLFLPQPGGSSEIREVLTEYSKSVLERYVKESEAIERTLGDLQTKMEDGALAPAGSAFTVVVDCGNGCSSLVAPQIFRRAGFKVRELFCDPDGRFPNREPNPAVPAHLTELQSQVLQHDASLGIAFDGDGDRVAFVGPGGKFIEIDKSIAVFSRYYSLSEPGSKIVHDIKCSIAVPELITQAGGIPIMERSGHTYMRATLLRERAIFGGELSGHCFFGSLGWDDAILAGLVFASIIRHTGDSLLMSIPSYPNTPDLRIPYFEKDKKKLLQELADAHEETGKFAINRLDGVRGENTQGWGLARISVTEPLFTFRFEGRSQRDLEDVINDFLKPVPKLLQLVQEFRVDEGRTSLFSH